MKAQDELYQKVRLTSRVQRVVLKSNSHYGQQDPQSQDARLSWAPSSDSKSFGETCNNAVDCRKSGAPLSAVEQQNTIRENKVKKLFEKFENHKHKESFLQDLSQTQKINKFSKESQDLIADLSNTEIFELCEISSKQQCPDCNKGGSTKGRGEASSGSRANLQTASLSSSTWDQTHWKTSNWNSQHSSSSDDW